MTISINFRNSSHSYTYSNEVGYSSPYGYSTSVTPQQTMGYDISADYVDSTTTYEPRSTMIDSDFISGHSEYRSPRDFTCLSVLYDLSCFYVLSFWFRHLVRFFCGSKRNHL